MNAELAMLNFIQETMRCRAGDWFFPLVTKLGDGGIFWILLTLLLLAIPKTRRIGYAMGCAILLEALCCNLILKPLVARVRPFDRNTAIQLLVARPKDFSFPSGHSAAAFAAAGSLLFGRYRYRLPVLFLAMLIAFSRLYLYVHYPSDVLAGVLLGLFSGWAGPRLGELVLKKFSPQEPPERDSEM